MLLTTLLDHLCCFSVELPFLGILSLTRQSQTVGREGGERTEGDNCVEDAGRHSC